MKVVDQVYHHHLLSPLTFPSFSVMQRVVSAAAAASSTGRWQAASGMACKAAAASSLTLQPHRSLHASATAGNNAIIVGSFAVAAGAVGMRYAMHVSSSYERGRRHPNLPVVCFLVSHLSPRWRRGHMLPAFRSAFQQYAPMPPASLPQAYNEWAASDTSTSFSAMKWHYRGGFEDDITNAEAAKILGIRESSGVDAVRKAHRKLMILNHPDAGGSTFLAGKINEAKDRLMGMHGSKPGMD